MHVNASCNNCIYVGVFMPDRMQVVCMRGRLSQAQILGVDAGITGALAYTVSYAFSAKRVAYDVATYAHSRHLLRPNGALRLLAM